MVKVFVGPSQVTSPCVKWGVTVMVAVSGAVPLFTAVKLGKSPLPLGSLGTAVVLSFVHV